MKGNLMSLGTAIKEKELIKDFKQGFLGICCTMGNHS